MDRTAKLNKLPVPGLPKRLPKSLSSSNNKLVCRILYHDFVVLVKKMRSAIYRGYHYQGSNRQDKTFPFGTENVQINKSIHRRRVYFSSLLGDFLFGVKFQKMKKYAVMETGKQIVCHLSSNQALESIFSVSGLSATTFDKEDCQYVGCGKIKICDLNDQNERTCYIMSTTKNKWKLQRPTTGNKILTFSMDIPNYNNGWIFKESYTHGKTKFKVVHRSTVICNQLDQNMIQFGL